MSSKNENVKVEVGFAHSAGSPKSLDRYSLLNQLVGVPSVIRSKGARFKEPLEQLAIPASLLLFLTVPLVLLCIGVESFSFLLFAIPITGVGISCGVLLFRYRSNKSQLFVSIVAQTLRSH